MKINEARLWEHLQQLGTIGKQSDGSVTRLAYTKEDEFAAKKILQWMQDANLNVYQDACGNVIGICEGTDPMLPPIVCGSHFDTVRNGGIFDGCLGVLGGIEAVESIIEQKKEHKRSIYVIGYRDEEGNRFGTGMIGSKAIAGTLQAEELLAKDEQGITAYEAMNIQGYTPAQMLTCSLQPIHSSVELHIEQGPILDQANLSLGIVEGIVHSRLYEVTFSGVSGHAGTIKMKDRHDPVISMSKWIQVVNEVVSHHKDSVATIGAIKTIPGSFNVICEQVKVTLDIRSLDVQEMEHCLRELDQIEHELIDDLSCAIQRVLLHDIKGCMCDQAMKKHLKTLMEVHEYSYANMYSGAGHDTQSLANICPCAMIFVRSLQGHSHRKEEYSNKEDCAKGGQVLMELLLHQANL